MQRQDGRRGVAIVEFAMTSLVLVMFVIVAFDFGIYALSFLTVQNAARAAVLRNSGGIDSADDQASACTVVLDGLRGLPTNGVAYSTQCDQAPLIVVAQLCDGADPCLGGSAPADGEPAATVRVTFTLPNLILIPNVGPTSVQKTVRMKVRNVS